MDLSKYYNKGLYLICILCLTGTMLAQVNLLQTFTETNLTGDSHLGFPVSTAGDVNGDGFDDVIVGACGYNSSTGRAYIYFGASGTTMDNTVDVTLTGEAANNYFGQSVSTAGDVNNDGFDDVILGAPNYNSFTGRAYIYFGAAGTTMDNTADVTFTGEESFNYFGWSVSIAGDVNGDGFDDVIVGARDYNSETGRAYIYFGATGATMDNTADVTFTGERTGNQFGWSVSTAGDVNNDSFDDVIVGTPFCNSFTGRAYIYYGAADETMDNTADVTFTGERMLNYFGCSVSTAGDVNGDGYDDVIVGAYRYNSETGRAYIYYGAADETMDNATDVTFTGDTTGISFGYSVSTAGDVNGDGFDDVIVWASGKSRVYIYFGAAGTTMDNTADVTFSGDTAGISFGYSVSTAGDVNGDGFDDVIVGACGYNSFKGRAYIYFGAADTTMDSTDDVTLDGENSKDRLGYSVSTAGDVNNDGFNDVIVGAYNYNSYTGRAYIYFGAAGTTMDNTADATFSGEGINNYFGWSVSIAGDVNGDGFDDIIVGAYNFPINGKAYIYSFSDSIQTAIAKEISTPPDGFSLYQNYPNPFNPSTAIRYAIPAVDALSSVEVQVTLKIYDILGNEVATLVNEQQSPGYYERTWNAGNVSSGIYFYVLRADEYVESRKMLLIK